MATNIENAINSIENNISNAYNALLEDFGVTEVGDGTPSANLAGTIRSIRLPNKLSLLQNDTNFVNDEWVESQGYLKLDDDASLVEVITTEDDELAADEQLRDKLLYKQNQLLTTSEKNIVCNNLGLHTVATSGSYNDLTDKPSEQDIINDINIIRNGASAGATAVQPSNLSTVAISGSYNDLTNKPTCVTSNVGMSIVVLENEDAYENLATKDANTIYLIKEE